MKKLLFVFIASLAMLSCNTTPTTEEVPVEDSLDSVVDTFIVVDSVLN